MSSLHRDEASIQSGRSLATEYCKAFLPPLLEFGEDSERQVRSALYGTLELLFQRLDE